MSYKIIRIDGEEDSITSNNFNNFSEAYDLLKEIYGDLCCSDVEYGESIYYNIVKIN